MVEELEKVKLALEQADSLRALAERDMDLLRQESEAKEGHFAFK